ncbi:MAG: hypothetical protein M3371_06085, partial [Acidobacteriota bacterium]|nr:hypothetical protein [Acidobacteriota bacterium]
MSRRASPMPIRFGTDGWRAVIADGFTFTNLERVAQAYADYLQQHSQGAATVYESEAQRSPLVIVGYDRRFLSEQFAIRTAEILAGNEIRVRLFDTDVPTPLVSWAVREAGAAGGVVITASHNPAHFNGFKIKAPWGGSATPETTIAVESLVDQHPPVRGNLPANVYDSLARSVETYREQLAAYIDLERLRGARARVIVDPMHGAGGRWVESFLHDGVLQA